MECRREDGYWSTVYTSRMGKLSIIREWLNFCNPAIEANLCRRLRSSALIQGFYSRYEGARMQEGVLSVNIAEVCFQQNLIVFLGGQSLRNVSHPSSLWSLGFYLAQDVIN